MKKKALVVLAVGMLLLMCLCYHGVPRKERLAYVGSTLITQQDVDAFSIISRVFPNPPEEFSLSMRPAVGALVETGAMYRKLRWNLANIKFRRSIEWKWRERYYVAYLYMENILRANCGYTDNELKRYYKGHQQEYTYTKVTSDSSGKKACSTKVVREFDELKRDIAEKMFLSVHKPDSMFKKSVAGKDTQEINREWLGYMMNQGFRDLFLREYFKGKYGKPLPDSLKDIYGKGKPVSLEDMNMLLSWVPSGRREQLKNNPQGLKDLALWLLRWKLFSEHAASTGYASQPVVQTTLKWAWRYELAQRYVTEKLAPMAKKNIRIDTAMALYSYWDDTETPTAPIDSTNWKNTLAKLVSREVTVKFDSLMYDVRRSERVRFLASWKDDKAQDAASLLRQADSLRDTGNSNDAQNSYQILVDNYCFTKEGKNALVELAKIRTEQQSYREAINSYRRYLVIDADKSKQCNTMFMIGFIYDEYLDKPDLAEANYKWVLKNAPDCELADDAEFMMLHLGEQMASVDELQAEVKRQGKKVEASETDTTGLKVEMLPAKGKKK
jgi:hypothetical protein